MKHQDQAVTLFNEELDKIAKQDAAEKEKDRLAQRQSQAAVALMRLGQPDRAWGLLRHRPDPSLRSYLIHRLRPLGADPQASSSSWLKRGKNRDAGPYS